jgi:predicted GNAT family N-acyltransferase
VRLLGWEAAAERAMPLRMAVFVVEQRVPVELEQDELDAVSVHALAETPEGAVVGTGRLLPDGHIGRMAVAASVRRQGVGQKVLRALVEEARRRGMAEVIANAQLSAEPFYRLNGFRPYGAVFMEAGIAHRVMRLSLAPLEE